MPEANLPLQLAAEISTYSLADVFIHIDGKLKDTDLDSGQRMGQSETNGIV